MNEPLAAREYPDLLILDVRVPGRVSGMPLLHTVRGNPATAKLPIPVATADVTFLRENAGARREGEQHRQRDIVRAGEVGWITSVGMEMWERQQRVTEADRRERERIEQDQRAFEQEQRDRGERERSRYRSY